METLTRCIKHCQICVPHLPLGPRPLFSAHPESRIVLIGQAPGRKVHVSGTPRDDKSGDTLRAWLGVSKEQFYDPRLFAIMPMGFCYPGKGKSGDLPPRKECQPARHQKLLDKMPHIQLYILIGSYAQAYYLGEKKQKTLTENVRSFQDFGESYFPLPHPSPRNNIWKVKNPWFVNDVLPALQERVSGIVG